MASNLPSGSIGPLAQKMGIAVTHCSASQVVATMPVAGNTQPFGLLHGGASAVLAESVGSLAALQRCTPTTCAVGVDLNITHHHPVTSGTVTATATVLHAGTRTATYEVTITNDAGKRVASARLTCMFVAAPQP